MYIATNLRERLRGRVEVRVLDCSVGAWDEAAFTGALADAAPDVVGLTVFTPNVLDVKRALQRIKKVVPGCVTVIGGPHVTSFGADALCHPEIDYGIMGYGEVSFPRLVEALFFGGRIAEVSGLLYRSDGEVVALPVRNEEVELDRLPIPDRTLVPYRDYRCPIGTRDVMATLVSSRGCPYPCTFCNSGDKRYRVRSMECVLQEVKYLAGLGIREIFFFDDLFNLNNKRVFEFCDLLRRDGVRITWAFKSRVSSIREDVVRAVKAAGCERIHFGLESNTDESLRALKKQITVEQIRAAVALCRKHRVNSVGSFMINLPGDTRQTIRERFAFANSLRLDYNQFGVLIAFSHTEIFRRGVEAGHWPADLWLRYVRDPTPEFLPPIWPNGIPREELYAMVREGLSGFYLRPGYVYQRLRNIHSLDEARKYARGALKLLSFRRR
jgi:radical SAM superfamily enzyme YgiQ (UPF0313 family)